MLFPNVINTNIETNDNHNIINPPIDDNASFNPENNFEIDNNDLNTIIPFQFN